MRWKSRLRFATLQIGLPLLASWALIGSLQAHFYPAPSVWARTSRAYGPVTLRLKLPGTAEGVEEPVVSVGRPGNATFVFLRLLKGNQAKVGIEFWGNGAWESEPFDLPAKTPVIAIEADFPALYPAADSADSGRVSARELKRRAGTYQIAVEGVVRLRGTTAYVMPPDAPRFIGSNPLGGSAVTSAFTGQVLGYGYSF